MSKAKDKSWQDILRDAIRQSGMTLTDIAKEVGIDKGQMSRFNRGERSLTIPTAEKIGKLLGLELRKKGGKR